VLPVERGREVFAVATRFLAGLLALVLLGAPAAAQPAPYTIDVIINLTGANAFAGATYADAMHVFEKYVNGHGGIDGRPLHLELHDDQTNPQVAVQLASQIIAKKPAVFIGGTQTADCAAVAPLVADGPVDFCVSPAYLPTPGGYAFGSSAALQYIIDATVRFGRLRGWKKFAIIDATDATGQMSDRMLNAALTLPENKDVKYVAFEHFTVGDISVAAQIQRMKAADPDAVMCFAAGTAFATVLKNLNDAGVALPVLTSAANLEPAQLAKDAAFVPPELDFNALLYYGRDRLPKNSRLKSVVDAFWDAYKAAGSRVTPGSGFAWDPLWITVSALRKLGTAATAQQLRDYLLALHDFDGVSGTYDFRIGDQHGLSDKNVIFVRWDPKTNDFAQVSGPSGIPL
jgi:branched-chain amino acid transport system substrate-binding protein